MGASFGLRWGLLPPAFPSSMEIFLSCVKQKDFSFCIGWLTDTLSHVTSHLVPQSRTTGSGVGDILTLFRRHDTLTRAAVSRRTGLSRATVNQRLDALITAGLLVPAGEEAPTRGRPAEHFAFNGGRGVLLVADIGGHRDAYGPL